MILVSAKFSSPRFTGTNGETAEVLKDMFDLGAEPTSTVWGHIHPTQPNYPNTLIPRSFIVETESEQYWAHGNATKHMAQLAYSIKDNPRLAHTNPHLFSQFVLYDFRKSLSAVTSKGVTAGVMYESGHWPFQFSKKESDVHTVIVHALFKGFK